MLGPTDMAAAQAVLALDPVVNVFVDYRSRLTHLDQRWLGGQMWGYFVEGVLMSLCHVGANLVPVMADDEACTAFADFAARQQRISSTIVGPRAAVTTLWSRLQDEWGPARDERWDQPHLELRAAPQAPAHPQVRRLRQSELELVYPACVAMYTEEVGVSPEVDGGRNLYRARVAQLISRGWAFALIDDDRVVFKAEIACATPYACQIQGVYVSPDRRGEGLATSGVAAVADYALREVAPAVSLYVNAHNRAARTAYERVGFVQTETFSTVMI